MSPEPLWIKMNPHDLCHEETTWDRPFIHGLLRMYGLLVRLDIVQRSNWFCTRLDMNRTQAMRIYRTTHKGCQVGPTTRYILIGLMGSEEYDLRY